MRIDLNADLGEGVGKDALLMPYLTSCNIACGVHAGDIETIQKTVRLAIYNKVKIGAHPSFPDRENFGRLPLEMPGEELKEGIIDQIKTVKEIVENEGATLHHVKPHGALYNLAAIREDIAHIILNALHEFNSIVLYAPFGSVISNLAKRMGVKHHHEVFADRNYNDDLTLVSRGEEYALLHDPDVIAAHVLQMVKSQKVKTVNGIFKPIEADTVCIHGDNPNAVEIIEVLRSKLSEAGVEIL